MGYLSPSKGNAATKNEGGNEMNDANMDSEDCSVTIEQMQKTDIKIKYSTEPMKILKKQFKKHILSLMLICVVIAVTVISFIQGKFYLKSGDELGYVLFYFYFLIPLVSLICSFFLGMRDSWLKWICPVVFGTLNGIAPVVFSNTDFEWFFFGLTFVLSCMGLGVGMTIKWAVRKNKSDLNKVQ